MSTASLLSMARLISKDPNDEQYSVNDKYTMLSIGQEAVATYIHYSYVRQLHSSISFSNIASPGDFDMPSDFLKKIYFETDIPAKFIELPEKEQLRNTIEGGTDTQPSWYIYNSSGTLKGRVLVSTYPISSATLYYVKRPPNISASQEPLVYGLDFLILQHFKHLFHLAEGQVDLASVAIQSFFKYIDDLNGKLR